MQSPSSTRRWQLAALAFGSILVVSRTGFGAEEGMDRFVDEEEPGMPITRTAPGRNRFALVSAAGIAVAMILGAAAPSFASSASASLSIGGTVESVSTSRHSFTVKTIPGNRVVTISAPSSAKIFYVLKGKAPGTGPLSELKAGDTVVVAASSVGGNYEAVTIDATDRSGSTKLGTPNYGSGAPASGMGGTIARIDARAHSFTLRTDVSPSVGETGKSYTILTSSSTKFVSTTGKVESFGALKVGEHVGVVGSTAKDGFLATNLSIRLSATTTGAASGNTTVGGSNGSITVGAKLPAGFPKAVPLPARSTLVAQISTSSKFYDLWFAVTGGQASVDRAYKAALGKAGFTITSSGGTVGSAMAIVSKSSAWGVTVTVFATGAVAGIPKSDLRAGQVEVVLVVT